MCVRRMYKMCYKYQQKVSYKMCKIRQIVGEKYSKSIKYK